MKRVLSVALIFTVIVLLSGCGFFGDDEIVPDGTNEVPSSEKLIVDVNDLDLFFVEYSPDETIDLAAITESDKLSVLDLKGGMKYVLGVEFEFQARNDNDATSEVEISFKFSNSEIVTASIKDTNAQSNTPIDTKDSEGNQLPEILVSVGVPEFASEQKSVYVYFTIRPEQFGDTGLQVSFGGDYVDVRGTWKDGKSVTVGTEKVKLEVPEINYNEAAAKLEITHVENAVKYIVELEAGNYVEVEVPEAISPGSKVYLDMSPYFGGVYIVRVKAINTNSLFYESDYTDYLTINLT